MSDSVSEKLAAALKEIQGVQSRLQELQAMVSEEPQRQIRAPVKRRRSFTELEVDRILTEAHLARELGRGALQIVCKKWGVTSSHIHYFEKRAAGKAEQSLSLPAQ